MSSMQIIADENIPYADIAFSTLGQVHTVTGRQLNRAHLREAHILLVRSVTQVNAALLAGSAIRFVGTATIGCDHIDRDYLQQQGIGFASAPGSNATAAAEYVISALVLTAHYQGFKLRDKSVGIIGCGNVGSRVLRKLQALGVHCLIYDPPLQEKTGDKNYVDLNTLMAADIITLHVPLEKRGHHPTYHLVNADFLKELRKDAILINTSRGQVIDETALLNTLIRYPTMTAIVDVWNNEPSINLSLLQHVMLGTPHIAGYSLDGKARGTEMLYTAVCNYFNYPSTWQAHPYLPPPPLTRLSFSESADDEVALYTAVMACYDIRRDDAALRLMSKVATYENFFDDLRKYYPVRREFNCIEIDVPKKKSALAIQLQGLGFRLASAHL
jgi:erythronate-4-phosphate dehydrogenase